MITIEACEEGGNTEDLVHYLTKYKDLYIGSPTIVICLDTSAFLKDSLTVSSTLRGIVNFDLTATIGLDNLHSGQSGIVPDPYHIVSSLLDRIFDRGTQEVIKEFEVEIPLGRVEECRYAAS